MAQFTHKQAENFRLDVVEHFPQLNVEKQVLDVVNEAGEYQFSFFSIWSDNKKFTHTFHSEEGWNGFLATCQYIASAIADNQQSKEVETLPMTQKTWNEISESL